MNKQNINNMVNAKVNSSINLRKKLLVLMAGLCLSEAANQKLNNADIISADRADVLSLVRDSESISGNTSKIDALKGKIEDTKIENKGKPAKSLKSDRKSAAENVKMFSELPFAGVDFTDLFSNSAQTPILNKSNGNKTRDLKLDNAQYKAINKSVNEDLTQMLKHRMAERISDDENLSKALISTVSGNDGLCKNVESAKNSSVTSSSANKTNSTKETASTNKTVLVNNTNKNSELVDQSILDSLDILLSENTDSFKSIIEAKRNHAGTFQDISDLKNMDQSALGKIGFDNLSQDTFLLLVIMADEFMSALQDYFMISMWMSFGNMMLTPEFAYDYGINYDLLISAYNDKNEELLSNMFAKANYTGDMSGLDISNFVYESVILVNI